ncbi:hypothetical protein GCM10029978_105810 [Actinoallomurus acanthiterrae]
MPPTGSHCSVTVFGVAEPTAVVRVSWVGPCAAWPPPAAIDCAGDAAALPCGDAAALACGDVAALACGDAAAGAASTSPGSDGAPGEAPGAVPAPGAMDLADMSWTTVPLGAGRTCRRRRWEPAALPWAPVAGGAGLLAAPAGAAENVAGMAAAMENARKRRM